MTARRPRTRPFPATGLAVAVTAGTVALGMLLAAPAAADDSDGVFLQLSRDGVHFSPGEVHDIFAGSHGYVPGESRPGTVWIRNASRDSAQLSLAVDNMDQAVVSKLPEYLELGAAAGTRSARARALPGHGRCNPVFENWTLSGGQALRMSLDLNLSVDAPNSTRRQTSTFDLVFLLQATTGGRAVSPCAHGASVPATGSSAVRTPVHIGPAQIPDMAADGGVTWIMDDAGTDVPAVHPPRAAPGHGEPLTAELQGNVAAINFSPWPWLLALSAGAYMVLWLRSRRRNQ